ncbi:MAG: aminotransferase class III-fold pyridoxal phosphate-dependent enzyme [Bacteroidales bacterium]|nr:aminotransferase class III-fold pyridoxal phosphate-dependent enzyme [Bacteroidales bacterium]
MTNFFDHIIGSQKKISHPPVRNLASFLFKKLAHRDERSDIILSHDGNALVSVSLHRLRFIAYSLFDDFRKKGIKPGETVLLASLSGNNELFIALMFTALSSYGARVLLPMFMETGELYEWLKLTSCQTVILPEQEILSLNHHDKEKTVVKSVKEIALQKALPCYDILKDFGIRNLLYKDIPTLDFLSDPMVKTAIEHTGPDTEAMLITTSGSLGKSKIVVYEQGAFLLSCMSWREAGFYDKEKLGGRGFTPLFTHTMGVRAYFNALWTGVPVCLITTEWFEEKPETVRYFLLQMQPAHITGGPSVYNLLLELMRTFPEIKVKLRPHMRTLVSSGAPLNSNTVQSLESALGLTMHNAYGTTENQQALSTLMYDRIDKQKLKTLGLPLPGVTIGLIKLQDKNDLYKLYVNSPFGYKKNIGENEGARKAPKGFFNTGDIVRLEGNNRLYYEGREERDFFKDGFGVKIPINILRNYYNRLYEKAIHIEYFPIKSTTGLAVMIFIANMSVPEGKVTDQEVKGDYGHLLAEINTRLYKSLEPFEYRHRHICRFVLINSPVPLTGKGTVSIYKIESNFADIIDALVDPLSFKPAIENVESRTHITDTFTRHHNPYVGQMLAGLGIDYSYHKGKKDTLYTYRDGKEIGILDFAGGYGTSLLGHNNDKLKKTVTTFIENDEVPLSDQGSIQKYAGLLAEELNMTVGKITGKTFNVMFGSSGSEAVEIALHHAVYEWKKRLEKIEQQQFQHFGEQAGKLVHEIWQQNREILYNESLHVVILKNAFHGNTSGARALLGNKEKREPFRNILALKPIYIDDMRSDWKQTLEEELSKTKIKIKKVVCHQNNYVINEISISTVITAIIEPIVGEGGVHEVKREIMEYLSHFSFPLIMDEIQCGLGRSGSFLASAGINADYYLFGKMLGGNIEKISAVLIDKKRYQTSFGEYYVSTFSNGGLAAQVAMQAISIIKNENLPAKAYEKGKKLADKLNKIQAKYPTVIAEITGKGLMLGINFCDFSNRDTFLLRGLQENKLLGYLFSAYLLKRHNVRILPTLSAPNVLRVEPSAYVSYEEIDQFISAVEDLAHKIKMHHMYDLFLSLMDDDPFGDNKGYKPSQGQLYTGIDKPCENAVKVSSILHFAYPTDELRMIEKNLAYASDTGLRILFNKIQLLVQMKPMVLFAKNILGGKIHFTTILIPLDSAELERLHRQGKRHEVITKIQKAVDLAANGGAKVISLGGYTSIISNNGTLLVEPENTKLITGNTITAVVGIKRLVEEIENRHEFSKDNSLAIIGATGNIGYIITERLMKNYGTFFKKIILIGRNRNRLEYLLDDFKKRKLINAAMKIHIATDFSLLKHCNVIIAATNTNDPIIFPHHINENLPVLISDISVPSAVSPDTNKMKNVTNIPFASYITLPEDPDFVISSCSPRGTVFCCAAEAMLCGLEIVDIPLRGKISSNGIDVITKLAEKYHFLDKLGVIRSYKTGV